MEHLYPDYMELAETIKERRKDELGFTVNIGISNNKWFKCYVWWNGRWAGRLPISIFNIKTNRST